MIAKALEIRRCALTDEDRLPDGRIKPQAEKRRGLIGKYRTATDLLVTWDVDLESCLGMTSKADGEAIFEKLSEAGGQVTHPKFFETLVAIAAWVDPEIKIS